MCPAGFVDIARYLWGNNTCITIDLPLIQATSSGFSVGTPMATVMSMCLGQDAMMGTTYVDMVTASMSLMSLGPIPMTLDHPTATLEDVTEQESEGLEQTQLSLPNATGCDAIFPQQWWLSTLTLCKSVCLRHPHPLSTVNMLVLSIVLLNVVSYQIFHPVLCQ